MLKIGKEFHLLHVVSDLNAADEWYAPIWEQMARKIFKVSALKSSRS